MDDIQTKPITNFLQSVKLADRAPEAATAPAVSEDVAAPAPTAGTQGDADNSKAEGASVPDETEAAGSAPHDDLSIDHLTSDGIPFDGESGTGADVEGSKADDAAQPNLNAAENKTRVVLKVLRSVEQQIQNAIRLLEDGKPADASAALAGVAAAASRQTFEAPVPSQPIDGRVVEGVFDGQAMIGDDGKTYSVPPNYASKSKLVEGDMLKLTITPKGSFIYKQIGPIERSRLIGTLGYDETIGQYYGASDDRRWSVIRASVTYFKGEPGDEVVLLVPKSAPSKWAAVENIIKTNPLE